MPRNKTQKKRERVRKNHKQGKTKKERLFVLKGGKYVEVSMKDSKFDMSPLTRESHNCYTYYLDKMSGEAYHLCKTDLPKYNMCRRPQPGYASGHPRLQDKDYTCKEIMKRTISDNPKIRKINNTTQKCNKDEYLGAVVVAPKYDYHYYRYNDEGQWTHKPGYKPTTNLDAANNVITDPKKADRNYNKKLNYTQFCGYTCIPRNPNSKNMSHIPNSSPYNMNSTKSVKGRNRTRKHKKKWIDNYI